MYFIEIDKRLINLDLVTEIVLDYRRIMFIFTTSNSVFEYQSIEEATLTFEKLGKFFKIDSSLKL